MEYIWFELEKDAFMGKGICLLKYLGLISNNSKKRLVDEPTKQSRGLTTINTYDKDTR
jgi:hypothetical protein